MVQYCTHYTLFVYNSAPVVILIVTLRPMHTGRRTNHAQGRID